MQGNVGATDQSNPIPSIRKICHYLIGGLIKMRGPGYIFNQGDIAEGGVSRTTACSPPIPPKVGCRNVP